MTDLPEPLLSLFYWFLIGLDLGGNMMSLDTESLSNAIKTIFLARVAHELTFSARDTYEAGTENVLEPQVLRAYNETLYRVTAAVHEHLTGSRDCHRKIFLRSGEISARGIVALDKWNR
jgi:hypothetical protein